MTQHKATKTLSFKSLQEALATPGEFLFSDFSKLERPALLHLGFQALDAFQVGLPSFCHVFLNVPFRNLVLVWEQAHANAMREVHHACQRCGHACSSCLASGGGGPHVSAGLL